MDGQEKTYQKLLDMHVHTDNSYDGNHSTMFLCEQAEELGLRAVAFTDHLEMDFYREKHFNRTATQSFFEVSKARSAFLGKLIVCVGVELGQPIYNLKESEALLRRLPYDFVIGSVHNLRDMEDFWLLDYSKHDIYQLLDSYFYELTLLAQWAKFDTLAHLTYPLRYIVGDQGYTVDMSRYQKQIDEILKLLAENGRALEINTSGLRQKLRDTSPNEAIVRRFRELGGRLVTIGSDAHFAKDLGAGLKEGMAIAERSGFSCITLYQNREPVEIPIA